ncbi:MAG: hypothetical protein AB9880_00420 [Christensenellales bacterium]
MSQMNTHARLSGYTLAGSQMHPFERIVVSSGVEAPEALLGNEAQRVSYRAPTRVKSRVPSVRLPWALLLTAILIGIMFGSSMQRVRQAKALNEEFAQLQNKYTASQRERAATLDSLAKAVDSSYISYYAVQKLGMSLARNEETVQVLAPNTRPANQGILSGRMGGE